MDHVVYLDYKAKEMDKLSEGIKTMIIRGAAGRKLPYGRVNEGDILYFINNNGEGLIKSRANVKNVYHSDKMDKEQSIEFVRKNQEKLQLTDKQFSRWAGKKYIVLIEIEDYQAIDHFKFDKTNYSNMDDWLLVEDINRVK